MHGLRTNWSRWSAIATMRRVYVRCEMRRSGRSGRAIGVPPGMLREKMPFRVKGDGGKKGPDGYRDMLIWASIAEHAAANLVPDDTLILVTKNHTKVPASSDSSSRLAGRHPALRQLVHPRPGENRAASGCDHPVGVSAMPLRSGAVVRRCRMSCSR
jgi:hypothetical protein